MTTRIRPEIARSMHTTDGLPEHTEELRLLKQKLADGHAKLGQLLAQHRTDVFRSPEYRDATAAWRAYWTAHDRTPTPIE